LTDNRDSVTIWVYPPIFGTDSVLTFLLFMLHWNTGRNKLLKREMSPLVNDRGCCANLLNYIYIYTELLTSTSRTSCQQVVGQWLLRMQLASCLLGCLVSKLQLLCKANPQNFCLSTYVILCLL